MQGRANATVTPTDHACAVLSNFRTSGKSQSQIHRKQGSTSSCREIAPLETKKIVRAGSWQNGCFADFHFGAAGVFCGFVAGFFLLIFVGKGVQINPPGKSPAKSSKIDTTTIHDTFLQRGRAKKIGMSVRTSMSGRPLSSVMWHIRGPHVACDGARPQKDAGGLPAEVLRPLHEGSSWTRGRKGGHTLRRACF